MSQNAIDLVSMTGFARAEGASAVATWVWEGRSVNGRSLDVRLRTPPGLDTLDAPIREIAQRLFARGSLNLSLQVNRLRPTGRLRVDTETLTSLLATCQPLIDGVTIAPPRLDGLLALRGMTEWVEESVTPDEQAGERAAILQTAQDMLQALAASRRVEGAALAQLLDEQFATVQALCLDARTLAATQPAAISDRLHSRIAALGMETAPPERLAVEIALLASKADVREELDRLDAHVAQARTHLEASGPKGRALEFLMQEFLREANTLCSKSVDIELTRIGLALKGVIDQLKEQVANVE